MGRNHDLFGGPKVEKARQPVQGRLSRIDDMRHQITVGLKIVHYKMLALMFEPF